MPYFSPRDALFQPQGFAYGLITPGADTLPTFCLNHDREADSGAFCQLLLREPLIEAGALDFVVVCLHSYLSLKVTDLTVHFSNINLQLLRSLPLSSTVVHRLPVGVMNVQYISAIFFRCERL